MGKNIVQNISKNVGGKYGQKLHDHAKKSTTDALKNSSKRATQKQQKQLLIWLVIKLLMDLGGFQKIYNRVIQRHLKMNMIKKYLKKDMDLQKKSKKLLMNGD